VQLGASELFVVGQVGAVAPSLGTPNYTSAALVAVDPDRPGSPMLVAAGGSYSALSFAYQRFAASTGVVPGVHARLVLLVRDGRLWRLDLDKASNPAAQLAQFTSISQVAALSNCQGPRLLPSEDPFDSVVTLGGSATTCSAGGSGPPAGDADAGEFVVLAPVRASSATAPIVVQRESRLSPTYDDAGALNGFLGQGVPHGARLSRCNAVGQFQRELIASEPGQNRIIWLAQAGPYSYWRANNLVYQYDAVRDRLTSTGIAYSSTTSGKVADSSGFYVGQAGRLIRVEHTNASSPVALVDEGNVELFAQATSPGRVVYSLTNGDLKAVSKGGGQPQLINAAFRALPTVPAELAPMGVGSLSQLAGFGADDMLTTFSTSVAVGTDLPPWFGLHAMTATSSTLRTDWDTTLAAPIIVDPAVAIISARAGAGNYRPFDQMDWTRWVFAGGTMEQMLVITGISRAASPFSGAVVQLRDARSNALVATLGTLPSGSMTRIDDLSAGSLGAGPRLLSARSRVDVVVDSTSGQSRYSAHTIRLFMVDPSRRTFAEVPLPTQ
jgi:hypothetical protein